MVRRSTDPAAIDAEVDHVRSLGIVALRACWRSMFDKLPPAGLTKDIIARMITFRIQEEAFGGLDKDSIKLLDRLARGDKPGEVNIRLKPGTVLVREYKGERHTVTVMPDGFLWLETNYASLSTIARSITGTAWNGPRFFGLRMRGVRDFNDVSGSTRVESHTTGKSMRQSRGVGRAIQRSHRAQGLKRG